MVVLIIDGVLVRNTDRLDFDIVELCHPSLEGDRARFLKLDGNLYELQRLDQKPASWFLGSNVVSDGSILLATRVDPLLMALPLLLKQRSKKPCFLPLDHIEDDSSASMAFLKGLSCFDIGLICDSQSVAGMNLYRLNDDRVVDWLAIKVRRLEGVLKDGYSYSGPGSVEENPLVEALHLISDYIDPCWIPHLLHRFQVDVADFEVKEAPKQPIVPQSAPVKMKRGPKAPTKSNASKRKKVDTSQMRSLRSYFGPKA